MSSESNATGAELKALLDELKTQRDQIRQFILSAETARKAAHDHASYAYQAKLNAEEHARAISSAKGQVESDIALIATHKQKGDEQAAALSAARGNAETEIKIVTEMRRDAEVALEELRKSAVSAASNFQEVEQVKARVAEHLKSTLDAETRANEASVASNAIRGNLETLQAKSNEMTALISESCRKADSEAKDAEAMATEAKAEHNALKTILLRLKQSDAKASNYETQADAVLINLLELKTKIESLLPGATSAGLATAFNTQKQRFLMPEKRWFWTFITCIGLLLLISIPSFLKAAYGSVSTWSEIFQGLAMRLPVLAPLVWLAIYAGRNYMLAIRLGEDYAFKEAVSTAFEGYKREMKEIGPGDVNTPLTTLCQNVLRALAERPGRIYDGRQSSHTPIEAASEAVETIKELRNMPTQN